MKALLVYLLLGNDNIISTSFKVLIELISDENMEKNRTELVFKLGNKLIKFAQYKLMQEQDNIKSNDKDYRLYYLFKIISYDNIYKLLDNISEQVKFEVGESIIRIIGDKTI